MSMVWYELIFREILVKILTSIFEILNVTSLALNDKLTNFL